MSGPTARAVIEQLVEALDVAAKLWEDGAPEFVDTALDAARTWLTEHPEEEE